MLRCFAVRIPFAVYALALTVRAVIFGLHPDAAYPDSYYYVDVARSINAGHGFNIDFIYSFLDVGSRLPADPHLPIASNGFWMPLASIVQLPTIWLLGPTPLASALPFMLIGALAAPLTWLIAGELGSGRNVALAAAVAVAFPAGITLYVSQPDNIALYGPIAMAIFWLTARGLKGHRKSYAAAGLMVGLAALARNDGLIFGAVVGLAFFWDRWRAWRSKGSRVPQIPWRYAFLCFGLFLLVVGPWYLRQLGTFGSISPSSSAGLLTRTYNDTNCITCPTSLDHFLGQGIGPLLASRLSGLVDSLVLYCLLIVSFVLAPFVVIGAWARRRSVDFGPFFVYAGLLFVAMSLLFAIHVAHGNFVHSGVALAPYSFILAFEGAVIASRWAARHRPSWTEAGAARLFVVVATASVVLNGAAFTAISLPVWDAMRNDRLAAAQALDAAGVPATDLLLSADPAGFRYYTGRGGVVTPNDSLEVIHQVAIAYGTRWLILERSDIVEPMYPVIESLDRPDWIGPPVFTVPYTGPASGDAAVDASPALAIYPVCTSASDTRCGPVTVRRFRAGATFGAP